MAKISDMSALLNRWTGGSSGAPETLWWRKIVGGTTDATTSAWAKDGQPGPGATPGTTVAIPTRATAGALGQANPAAGKQKWITNVSMTPSGGGHWILYDRILHIGNFSANSNATQTVGGTLTRYTNGAGNFILAELYGTIGFTGTNFVVSYTNQDGVSGRATAATSPGAGAGAGNAYFLPLQDGDSGVQAIATCGLSAATGNTGPWGISICHPLVHLNFGSPQNNVWEMAWRDYIVGQPGMPEVLTDACLALVYTCRVTNPSANPVMMISMVEA